MKIKLINSKRCPNLRYLTIYPDFVKYPFLYRAEYFACYIMSKNEMFFI